MRRMALAVLLAISTMFAGCFGEGEIFVEEEVVENIWNDTY